MINKIDFIRFIFEDFDCKETIIEIVPTRNGIFSVPFYYSDGKGDIISGVVYDDNSVFYERNGINETRYQWFGLFGRYTENVKKELKSERYEVWGI